MGITVKGVDDLEKGLAKKLQAPENAKMLIKKHGANLQKTMMDKANFHGHYEWVRGKGRQFVEPTGTTKRNIELEIRDGGMTAVVHPATKYSPYLEYGTRKMEAQPFVGPAYNQVKPKFEADLKTLLEHLK